MNWPPFGSGTQETWWGVLIGEFLPSVLGEWKAWLTGSAPMAGLTVTGLVRPQWVAFPLWAWATLVFGVGLLLATFSVYHALHKERDSLRKSRARIPFEGPFFLVPLSGTNTSDFEQQIMQRSANDL